MSFSQDIRSSQNFKRMFGKEKRRIQLSEIPNTNIENLQTHVPEIRTQGHFIDLHNSTDNIESLVNGPHDYILEPDHDLVKLRTRFMDVGGIGNYEFQTIVGNDYRSIELYDAADISSNKLWYACAVNGVANEFLDIDSLWKWNIGFHPTSVPSGNSIYLNVGTDTKQMFYISGLGANYNFAGTDFSISFWIYPTDLTTGTTNRVVAARNIDASNEWNIFIDRADNKLWVYMQDAGVETKRQYDTPLTVNTWYHVVVTWDESAAGLVLKVNNNADTSSTKAETQTLGATDGFWFGHYPTATSAEDFKGYLSTMTYYNSTVLSSTEITRLFNYNTISDTTKPFTWGTGQYG